MINACINDQEESNSIKLSVYTNLSISIDVENGPEIAVFFILKHFTGILMRHSLSIEPPY